MPGDRGDFYRRKLAEQIYLHYSIQNIDHINILALIEGLLRLEHDCRAILSAQACQRSTAPPVNVDGQILSVIGRLAEIH